MVGVDGKWLGRESGARRDNVLWAKNATSGDAGPPGYKNLGHPAFAGVPLLLLSRSVSAIVRFQK